MTQQNISTANEQGFTLIEVLIAVAIFTIGILSVNAMQISSIKGNSTANNISKSITQSADRVEMLISLDFDDSLLDDTDGDGIGGIDDKDTDADGTATSADGFHTIYWNVAVDQPIAGIKTIKIITINQLGLNETELTYMKADSV